MSWTLDRQQVHMTVASSLHLKGGDPDFRSDLPMIKTALLYADQVKLVSLSSFALVDIVKGLEVRGREKLLQLRQYYSAIGDETKTKNVELWLEQYEYAKRRRHSRRGKELLTRLEAALEKAHLNLQSHNSKWIAEVGAEGVVEAVNRGLLDIYQFDSIFDRVIRQDLRVADIELEFVAAVSSVVKDAHTYPLFDEETSNLISSNVAAGDVPVTHADKQRSKEVALAADLLARLPLFEKASVLEILDIRRELEKPLRSFRSAMIKFSNQIDSASWDKDFPRDAESVFRSEIAPAVLALEDEEKSNSYLSKLTAKVADKSLQVGGAVTASGAISALAVRVLNLPLADVAALAVGPAIVAGGLAYGAYREWKERQKEIEGNSLFFYYKAGSFLEDGSFRYEDTNAQS